MIGFVWNCRGIGHPAEVRCLKEYISDHRPNFVFLSEIKCNSFDTVKGLVIRLGFVAFEFVPALRNAGGLLLAWDDSIDLKVVLSTNNLINCMISRKELPEPWQLSLVYGPTCPQFRPAFLELLHDVGSSFPGDWAMMGDFNMLLSSDDKRGGRPVAGPSRNPFRFFVDNFDLIDLGFIGFPFTWSNKRAGSALVQERLDRGFANPSWKLAYPEATITHIQAFRSDHRPLLFQLYSSQPSMPKPFRFESMWVTHPGTGSIIQTAWHKSSSFLARFKNTKLALKVWNRKTFGLVQDRIRQLKDLLLDLQSQPSTVRTSEAETTLQFELNEYLKREELLWRDKAKSRWIEAGDANTRFFHLTTVIHRRYNSINRILASNNQWLHSRGAIGQEFECFFRELFTSIRPRFPIRLHGLLNQCVTEVMNQQLIVVPSSHEILLALKQMGNLKSPGPDGFNVLFFKSYWNIVGVAVTAEIQSFFVTGKLKPALNHTFIALLPKVNFAFKVDQFRPIALCNVVYKIITKILAGRLRGMLDSIVHPSQAAFVPKSSIIDNIIINHEVMFYLKHRRGCKGFMAIKVDLAKAYDRVEWNVLYHILYLLGFHDHFIDLVVECISSPHYSLLINGSPHGFFHPGKRH